MLHQYRNIQLKTKRTIRKIVLLQSHNFCGILENMKVL